MIIFKSVNKYGQIVIQKVCTHLCPCYACPQLFSTPEVVITKWNKWNFASMLENIIILSYFPFHWLLVFIGPLSFFFVNLILMPLPIILWASHQFHK